MFSRQNSDCATHEWDTTVHSGLRRDLCVICGRIRMESIEVVTTRVPAFAEGRTQSPTPGNVPIEPSDR